MNDSTKTILNNPDTVALVQKKYFHPASRNLSQEINSYVLEDAENEICLLEIINEWEPGTS